MLHRTEIYISVCPSPYHEGTQGEQIHGSTHRADTNQDSPPVKRFSVDFQLHIWSKSILWFRHHAMKRTIKHLYHTHAHNVWKYKFHVGMSVPSKYIHVTNIGRLKSTAPMTSIFNFLQSLFHLFVYGLHKDALCKPNGWTVYKKWIGKNVKGCAIPRFAYRESCESATSPSVFSTGCFLSINWTD